MIQHKIKDINHSYSEYSSDDIEYKKKLIDTLSVYEEGYKYNPLFRSGVWDGKKHFYKIMPNTNIRFPKGLVKYVERDLIKNNKEYLYESIDKKYDLSREELENFIRSLKIPFEPYDYQIDAVYKMITEKRLVLRSATGCLDPKSEITAEISKEDYEFLRKNFQSQKIKKIKTLLTYEEIEFLLKHNKKVKIQSTDGFTTVKKTFIKKEKGCIIYLDDNSQIKCAITHNLLSSEKWKTPYQLKKGDYLTDKYGQPSKKITKIEFIDEQEWIDFEVSNKYEAYIQNDVIHHNSGKSLIAYIFLMFMLKENKNSLLVVPSINLVDQMFSDFVDYGMQNAEDFIKQIGGEHKSSKDLSEKPIVISTWQSLQRMSKKEFEIFEVILVDECHTAKSDVLNSIINKSINSSWKIGMTGTVPRTRVDKLMLFGALGRQYTVITPGGLIKRGLATPITINALYLNYSKGDRELFNRGKPAYQDEVKFVEKHYFRNKKIGEMLIKIASKGNVLSLFTHIEHGESLLRYCIEERTGYSNIELLHKITPKPIKEAYEKWEKDNDLIFYMNSPISKEDRDKIIKNTSKISPEHAVQFCNSIRSLDDINIFFVSGKVSGADREYIRKNLETIHINEIILEFEDFTLKVNKDEEVLLENGDIIKADKISEDTDISNKWIEEKKNEQNKK